MYDSYSNISYMDNILHIKPTIADNSDLCFLNKRTKYLKILNAKMTAGFGVFLTTGLDVIIKLYDF